MTKEDLKYGKYPKSYDNFRIPILFNILLGHDLVNNLVFPSILLHIVILLLQHSAISYLHYMKFTKKTFYTFVIIFGIALIIGFLELNSYSYAFSEKNVSDITTTITPKLLSNLSNSNIQDTKILFITDGLFSDAGWGAFGYNAARSLEGKYGYHIDFKENIDIPEILKTMTHVNKFLLLSVTCIDCITRDPSMRKKEVYASFEDASCIFRNRGIIIYPIPIISKVRKPSICSIL